MSSTNRQALFLDRDGVINVDRGFVYRREDFEWLPGIFDLVRSARRHGLPVVVVTNQSGIGRGYYSEDDFFALTRFMQQRFEAEDAPLTAVYHCPFHPQAEVDRYRHPDHPWRKPHPGMLLQARADLGLDLARSVIFGDRSSDLEAGAAAGLGHLALIGSVDIAVPGLPSYRRFLTPGDAVPWLEALAAPQVVVSGLDETSSQATPARRVIRNR